MKKKMKMTTGAAAADGGGANTGGVGEAEFGEGGEGFGDDDSDDDDDGSLFPNAFWACEEASDGGGRYDRYPRTLIELTVLRIMQAIAEKNDWQRKLRDDPQIFGRWLRESHAHESVVRYAIDEMLSRDADIRARDPTPRSLTDLCIDVARRSLPNLGGKPPPGLPQELLDRITMKVTSPMCSTRFDEMIVRVDPSFKLEVHMDTDEANACDLERATKVELIKS